MASVCSFEDFFSSKRRLIRHNFPKRGFDLLFSLCALIALAPIMLLLILLIRLTSPGAALYGHQRIGRAGKPFKCYKFRTMYRDADQRLESLLADDPKLRAEWKRSFKLKNDPRVTPLGRFLRKTSLDELPQFWNVLRGDLSVVGPRPLVHKEIQEYLGSKAEKILSMRPGLTCLWQTSGRSDTSYSQRIAFDETYIDTRSFWMDVRLICKTVPVMLFPKGAY